MMIIQEEIILPAFGRGYHLIDTYLTKHMPELPDTGLVNIFLHHTSAALTINENADPTVRVDFESFINKLIPENDPVYKHIFEGPDDMPAHLKSSLLGQSINIPVRNRRMKLGTWQGIYLCEFRNRRQHRKITVTVVS